jgi:hypothetical protein
MYDIYKRLPFNSDFTEWKRAGANGFNVAYVDNFAYYHTRNDNPDNISLASLQNHGSYALGLARHFGSIPLDNVTAPDAIYFNVGSWMFQYPLTWGMPLALAAALLFAVVLLVGFVRRHLTVGGLIAGTAVFPLALLAAMLVTVAGAAIAYGPRVLMRFYTVSITHLPDLQVLYNNNLFGLAFAVMAVGVAAFIYALAAKKIRVQNLAAGALIWWVVLLAAILKVLPGGSYIPMWTLFFSSLGLGCLFLARDPDQLSAPRVTFAALFAVPGIVLTIPAFQMALSTLMMMAAPALVVFPVLLFGLLAPQAEVAGRANRAWFPALAFVIGLLLFVIAVATDGVSAKRPKLDNLCYAMDYDTGKACWFSDDPAPDEWTSQFFKAGEPRAAMDDFMPWDKNMYLKAEAPAAPYAGPVVSAVSDVVKETREITLHVASDEPGKRVELRFEGPEVLSASVFGQELKAGKDRSRINLRLFPAGGVDVSLKVALNGPLVVAVSEELCGLPQFPGMQPRPPHIICMPNTVQHGRSFSSDHVYLKHTFTFPQPKM